MTEHYAESVHNREDKKAFRKKLRNELTPAEAALWKELQRSKLAGRKFRGQHSVGPYILDFYCPAEDLAVELDGEGHFHDVTKFKDRERRKFLTSKGIKVIRFENSLVFNKLGYVLEEIVNSFGWKNNK